MSLNQLKPAPGSRKQAHRVGRGIGSGSGKTAGRGHKGQKARSGGYHKVGFEGGQMPIQRRLPKFGFTSRIATRYAEVRLHELVAIDGEVNPAALIDAGVVPLGTRTVKIILSGEVSGPFKVAGCRVTKGARAAIEAAGGSVADVAPDAPRGRLQPKAKPDGGTAASAPGATSGTAPGAEETAAPAPSAAADASTAPEASPAPAGDGGADAPEDTSAAGDADGDTGDAPAS